MIDIGLSTVIENIITRSTVSKMTISAIQVRLSHEKMLLSWTSLSAVR
jgi:hypothetical protein